MTGHALYAPSSMARILACPPSATLSQKLPEKESPHAKEGTRVHAVLAKALQTGVDPLPAPWQDNGERMPDAHVVGYTRAFLAQLGAGQVLIEQRVHLTKGCWGTLDLGHVAPIITIVDYKNGGWDVEARNNKQLLTYAAAFLDDFPDTQHFRLVIFQPNSWANKDDAFKQHVHTRAEVEAHRQDVLNAIAYQGPPRPGPHCRWCPAFPCSAMAQDAYFMMGAIARDPATLAPQELARMLRIIRGISDMKETLERHLTDALKMGAKVDGVELKPSTKWAAWNDDRHAAETLWREYGAKGVKAITPAAAKKLGAAGAQYAAIASHKPEPELKAKY